MSNIMKTQMLDADAAGYANAVQMLKSGALVALPTDTVYALAGLAGSESAVAQIYAVKNRPPEKALSVVVFKPRYARQLAIISPLARSLMAAFWPGALTLVLPLRSAKTASTIAIRCPDTPWTDAFLRLGFEGPLVLPSANISGNKDLVSAAQVMKELGGKIPLILDGGICKAGQASTILAVDGAKAKVLRFGAIAPERLAAFDLDMGFS